jgi:hypothetical protein
MKYFIQIKTNTFAISKLLANAIKKHDFNYKIKAQNQNQTFILNSSHLNLFQIIQTSSLTHFYITVSNQEYRVNDKFYLFLKSLNRQNMINRKMDSNRQLGQYFTKQAEYILNGLTIPNNVKIVEPFAGDGDLVAWAYKFQPEKIECFDVQP